MIKHTTPNEYLETVLREWKEFCKYHRRFTKALVEILAENERLKNEIIQLKGEFKDG